MVKPLPEDEWKLKTNAQYQEAIKILINLATASLALPVVFLKELAGSPNGSRFVDHLKPSAYWSWAFLFASLLFGMLFYWASAKFVKVVCGGPEDHSENWFEKVRDATGGAAVVCFLAGLVSFLIFFRTRTL